MLTLRVPEPVDNDFFGKELRVIKTLFPLVTLGTPVTCLQYYSRGCYDFSGRTINFM